MAEGCVFDVTLKCIHENFGMLLTKDLILQLLSETTITYRESIFGCKYNSETKLSPLPIHQSAANQSLLTLTCW